MHMVGEYMSIREGTYEGFCCRRHVILNGPDIQGRKDDGAAEAFILLAKH